MPFSVVEKRLPHHILDMRFRMALSYVPLEGSLQMGVRKTSIGIRKLASLYQLYHMNGLCQVNYAGQVGVSVV